MEPGKLQREESEQKLELENFMMKMVFSEGHCGTGNQGGLWGVKMQSDKPAKTLFKNLVGVVLMERQRKDGLLAHFEGN